MSSVLFKNGIVISQNSRREVFRGNVLVNNGIIEYTGKEAREAEEIVDCTHKIVMPGLINTHTHVAMAHLKGQLDDMPLSSFLEKTFVLDGQRTEKGLYRSAVLGSVEMLNSGVTSFLDLYYGEDLVTKACMDVGIRGFLSWNTLDQDKTTQSGDTISNAENFIKKHAGSDLVRPSIGVQGVYVAEDDIFMRAKEVSARYGTLVHIHLAETREEVYNFARGHGGERPIEHLHRIGFLGSSVVAAHCVWANSSEISYLAKNDVSVSWNPVSNSKLGVGGIAPVIEMKQKGVRVSIGSDSSGSNNSLDVMQSMKMGALMVKNQRWDPSVIRASEILDMATVVASSSLRADDIGSIEPGKRGDIITLDTQNPRLFPTNEENAISNVVYSADSSCVSDVMVNGDFRKRSGILLAMPYRDWKREELV